jgi:hypothetical protein
MIKEIEKIAEGWKNLIFQNPVSEEIGKKRLAICFTCMHRKPITNRCGVCHCYLPAAVRSSKKKCLKRKW